MEGLKFSLWGAVLQRSWQSPSGPLGRRMILRPPGPARRVLKPPGSRMALCLQSVCMGENL
jgi:hypothetical protein